jgi:hypothetical protein
VACRAAGTIYNESVWEAASASDAYDVSATYNEGVSEATDAREEP